MGFCSRLYQKDRGFGKGEYEFGSPKKPAIMEAMALNFADNTDAKMQTFTELLNNTKETGWLGFNRLFESNLRATRME